MNRILSLALSVFVAGASTAVAKENTEQQTIMAMGAYIASDDIATSTVFYRDLFERSPLIELPDFVAFEIEGGWFAIASRSKYAPRSVAGSGAVPYLQAGDLDTLQTLARNAGARDLELIEEPGIHLLKMSDPNGQLIEFFSLVTE